jgi:hypothetical protein
MLMGRLQIMIQQKEGYAMPHQVPKEAQRDSFNYGLTHEVGFLIKKLAAHEAADLKLPDLSPADYLSRLIKREAESKLDEQTRQEAHAFHEQRTAQRLQTLQERKERRQREKARAAS